MSLNADLPLQLIEKISLFDNKEQALLCIKDLSSRQLPFILSFVNAHAYNLCHKETEFANAILESDIVLRDGYGMEVLLRSISKSPGANLNGTDFIPWLLSNYEKKIALLGTEDDYLKKATIILENEGHEVVLTKNGFLQFEEYLPCLKSTAPNVIVLGMGMPKQEKLSLFLKANLTHPCIIINGGAIIDFWAGKFKRAPLWMRESNTEWLFRFVLEPRRLMRRYIIGNYLFLKRIRKLKLQFKDLIVNNQDI